LRHYKKINRGNATDGHKKVRRWQEGDPDNAQESG